MIAMIEVNTLSYPRRLAFAGMHYPMLHGVVSIGRLVQPGNWYTVEIEELV